MVWWDGGNETIYVTQILSDFYETEGLKNDSIKKREETFFCIVWKKHKIQLKI